MIDQTKTLLFNRVYDETYNNVLKYVSLRCSDIGYISDIIQDVYLDVYSAVSKKDCSNIENMEAFVISIAKKKVVKYYSFKNKLKMISTFSKSENEKDLLDNIPDETDIESFIINGDDVEKIWEFLNKKKKIIRKIFYLYYYLDLTIVEISNQLNIKISTTKNYLYRTLKEINKFIVKDGD